MDEKGKSWSEETQKRFNVIQRYFKPNESLVIVDFIRTAEAVKEEEM